MYELRNDRYRKTRGGKAYVIEVSCRMCDAPVLHYQKDGNGRLKRCYLNRILSPEKLSNLQYRKSKKPEDIEKLICPNCKSVLGVPIRHHDGRLAFRLRQACFLKRRLKV